ncbi:sensor protein degS [Streptomyces azureus]|uniref:Sensor protein degS n=1 Tax=Streptomyces azureus TaxID=146537 RepID=A0A0K8PYH0_STRAJ|nr:sensor protein degS [Streptomyces azureus]
MAVRPIRPGRVLTVARRELLARDHRAGRVQPSAPPAAPRDRRRRRLYAAGVTPWLQPAAVLPQAAPYRVVQEALADVRRHALVGLTERVSDSSACHCQTYQRQW